MEAIKEILNEQFVGDLTVLHGLFICAGVWALSSILGEKKHKIGAQDGRLRKVCTGCSWKGNALPYEEKCPNCGARLRLADKKGR